MLKPPQLYHKNYADSWDYNILRSINKIGAKFLGYSRVIYNNLWDSPKLVLNSRGGALRRFTIPKDLEHFNDTP